MFFLIRKLSHTYRWKAGTFLQRKRVLEHRMCWSKNNHDNNSRCRRKLWCDSYCSWPPLLTRGSVCLHCTVNTSLQAEVRLSHACRWTGVRPVAVKLLLQGTFLRMCIIAIHHYAKCMWERVGARQHLQRIQWVTAENFASLEGCTAALNFWCILSEGWHIILPYSRNLIFENETVECNFRCIYIPLKMRCHRAAEEIVKNCDVCAKETKCDL